MSVSSRRPNAASHRPRAWLAAVAVVGVLGAAAGCSGFDRRADDPGAGRSGAVRITLLQLNDVYEITPIDRGRQGGLARVATIRKRLLAENPHTFTLHAGDFLSPSALATAEVEGKPLAGQQMISVMNAVGFDWVTFGNHEFDLGREAFYERLVQASFGWVSSNVTDENGEPFPGVPRHALLTVRERDRTVRIGLVTATVADTVRDYVRYDDPIDAVRWELAALPEPVDIVVALTHQTIEQDVALVESIPEIDLVLGGHEHENFELRRGPGLTPILKADGNARTVFVHRLSFDPKTRALAIDSRLVHLDESVPEDPAIARLVGTWVERAYEAFRRAGFDPERVVGEVPVALDGRDAAVRRGPTALTELIGSALLAAVPGAELAVFNAGGIRVDDLLPPGALRQYDVLRILPFPDRVTSVEISGRLLADALDRGARLAGSGGLLQGARFARAADGGWEIGGERLDPGRSYRMASNEYLISGRQSGLEILRPGPDLEVLERLGDVRQALIAEIARRWGGG